LNSKKKISIIPAFEPENELLILVNELITKLPNLEILIINDGSNSQFSIEILTKLEKNPRVTIVNHTKNKGKGAALKTGFKYILDQNITDGSVVTADADGQHLASDIIKVLNESDRTALPILGVRSFDSNTPTRSLFGNKITSIIFKLISGKTLVDTQSGLRAFPIKDLNTLLKITGHKYDYEMRQLTEYWQNTQFKEIPITTVYQPNNPTSHFHPFIDSMRIYWVLGRHFLASSFIGFIDFIILLSLINIGASPTIAITISRATSSVFYFVAIKRSVFRITSTSISMIIKFSINIGFNIWLFPVVYTELKKTNESTLVPLLITYIIFYVFNFLFQNFIVFRAPKKNDE